MSKPTVTIIICARNATAHLRQSIPAALAQDYPPGRFKVMVVNNRSSDNTAELARELGALVRSCPTPGVTFARQFGWQTAQSELVAYLDADCIPPADWLVRLVALFEKDKKLGAAGARLVAAPPETIAERHIVEARILDTDRFRERNALQFPFVVTAGMVVRRCALEAVGGFDTELGRYGGEDADLCWRLERAGWSVAYAREVEVVHCHRSTVRGMLRQAHWYGMGSAALFARWRKELGWWRYTDRAPYRRLAGGLVKAIPALITGADSLERLRPSLEVLDAIAFLTGKWRGALRHRVFFL